MRFIVFFILSLSLFGKDPCFNFFRYERSKVFPYQFGKKLYSSTSSKRKLKAINDIKLATYNLENFAKTSSILNENEIKDKTVKILKAIESNNVDIIALQEVLDLNYLEQSVKEVLGKKYKVLYVKKEFNQDNIAFLVKNDLPLNFEVHSLKDYKFDKRIVFNKDFPILEIKMNDKTIGFYGGLHLKSKFGGSAKNGFYENIRTRQVTSILKIKQKIELEYPGVPFIIGGDFNNDLLSKAKEVNLLKKYMSDSFEFSSLPRKERFTNMSSYKGKKILGQLDGIFFSKSSEDKVKVLRAKIHEFSKKSGYKISLLDPRVSRRDLVSDHSMVVVSFDFKKLIDSL